MFIGKSVGYVLLAVMAGGVSAAASCTVAQGQAWIDQGQYGQAIQEFTCIINGDPTGVEGYRGRIEAEALAGQFSNAVLDYARVTAFVIPAHPDTVRQIYGGYSDRLARDPNNIPALTGLSFARW